MGFDKPPVCDTWGQKGTYERLKNEAFGYPQNSLSDSSKLNSR